MITRFCRWWLGIAQETEVGAKAKVEQHPTVLFRGRLCRRAALVNVLRYYQGKTTMQDLSDDALVELVDLPADTECLRDLRDLLES